MIYPDAGHAFENPTTIRAIAPRMQPTPGNTPSVSWRHAEKIIEAPEIVTPRMDYELPESRHARSSRLLVPSPAVVHRISTCQKVLLWLLCSHPRGVRFGCFLMNIGETIRNFRLERGMSQGDIEKRTGLLRCYLSRVENGHTIPSLDTLAKIAGAMELALSHFFARFRAHQWLQRSASTFR